MKKIRWYIRALRWLWANRKWHNSMQKWKAFDRAMREDTKCSDC